MQGCPRKEGAVCRCTLLALGRTRTCVGLLCARRQRCPSSELGALPASGADCRVLGLLLSPQPEPAQSVFCSGAHVGSWNREPRHPLMPGTFPAVWGGEERAAALGGRGWLEAYSAIGGPPTTRCAGAVILSCSGCAPAHQSPSGVRPPPAAHGSKRLHGAGRGQRVTLGHPPLICGVRTEQDLTPEVEGRTVKPSMVKAPRGVDVRAAARNSAKDTCRHLMVGLRTYILTVRTVLALFRRPGSEALMRSRTQSRLWGQPWHPQ